MSQLELFGFPKIWASFPDERIKFIRNVVEFNLELKMYYLNLLSSKPNCNSVLTVTSLRTLKKFS